MANVHIGKSRYGRTWLVYIMAAYPSWNGAEEEDFTPSEAREFANQILKAADEAEEKNNATS